MTWFQADEACKLKGGRLPEINDYSDHFNIVKLKVTYIFNISTFQSRPVKILDLQLLVKISFYSFS